MKYFTIAELTKSATADARGIDNTPPPEVRVKLSNLIHNLLDPIRERWGAPIYVNSGFRCPQLNMIMPGASPTSQHMKGEAADITAGSVEKNRRLFELIKAMAAEGVISFDQLIDEQGLSWIHVSHKAGGGNRGQILKKL